MISVKVDSADLRRVLADGGKKATRSAAIALTKTAGYASADLQRGEFLRAFDRPTDFTQRATLVVAATAGKLVAEVRFKDRQGKYLAAEVAGGVRRRKAYERALSSAGWLPAGYVTVPGEGAPVDSFGNIPRAFLVAIMRQLGNGQGYGGAKGGDAKKQARDKRRHGEFFVVPVGKRSGRDSSTIKQPGIYQVVQFGFGQGIRPVLIFVRQAQYQRRIDLQQVGQRAVSARFAAEFDKAFRT